MAGHAATATRAPRSGRHEREDRLSREAGPSARPASRHGVRQVGPHASPDAEVPARTCHTRAAALASAAPLSKVDSPSRPLGAYAVLPVQRLLVAVGPALHTADTAAAQGAHALQVPRRPTERRHPLGTSAAERRKERR